MKETRDPHTGEVLANRDWEQAIFHFAFVLPALRNGEERLRSWVQRVPSKLFSTRLHRHLWEGLCDEVQAIGTCTYDELHRLLLGEFKNDDKLSKWKRDFLTNPEALEFITRPEQMVAIVDALWDIWARRERRKALVDIAKLAEEGGTDDEIRAARLKLQEVDTELQARTLRPVISDEQLLDQKFEDYGQVLGDGLFVKSGFHYIHARDGVGKTYLALQLSHALCTADTWLDDLAAPEENRVLYVQAEMTKAQLQRRVASLKRAFGPLHGRLLTYTERFPLARQTGKYAELDLSGFGRLESLIQKHQPDVTILDPLVSFTERYGVMLNDGPVAGQIVGQFIDIARAYNTALIVVHHQGKDRDKGLRGNSILRDEAAGSIGVWKHRYREKFLWEIEFDKVRHRRDIGNMILKRDEAGWFEEEMGLTELLRKSGKAALIKVLKAKKKDDESS